MALYRDIDLSFQRDALSGDIPVLEDEAAVSQSVRQLVLTSLYERPFQPSLGSVVYQLLFEPLTEITKLLLARTIRDTISQFESRATVKFVDVYTDVGPSGESLDDHTVIVDVGFFVHNRPNLVTTPIVLRRLR